MLRLIKNLEQLLVIALLMLFAALLGGCADKGSVILDTPLGGTETVSDDMGRYSAWAKAETARITALKSLGTSKEPKEGKEKVKRGKRFKELAKLIDRSTAYDPADAIARINPNIYGHFAEHLGRCIYDGVWVGPDSPIPNRVAV